jgi:hypothetical protein
MNNRETNDKFLLDMMKENLERLKNIDRSRISIYIFYVVITGGILVALMTQQWNYKSGLWIFLFLFIISVVTCSINLRIKDHVDAFTEKLREISKMMGTERLYTDGGKQGTLFSLRNIYIGIPLIGAFGFFVVFCIQLYQLITCS